MKILVTGGVGFIGSTIVIPLRNDSEHQIESLDKLINAASIVSLAPVFD